MRDHLDVWDDDSFDVPAPDGQFRGSVWVGEITIDQAREIFSRANCYAGERDYRESCPNIERAAHRVLRSLRAKWSTYVLTGGDVS
jgi:hypothetical protein